MATTRVLPRSLRPPSGSDGAPTGDRAFGAIGAAATGAVGLIVIGVAVSVLRLAWPSVEASGGAHVFAKTWDPLHGVFGGLAFIYGTLFTSVIALALALPVGLGVALFLTDFGSGRAQRWVSSLIELLAAIPSVVYGLWAALVLAPLIRQVLGPDPNWLGGLLRGPNVGFGFLCASLVLAVMLVPTIALVSRDVMRGVPSELREGALALGATPWDVVRLVIFPYARRGIFGAVLLAFGRAVGETMAVAAVIGSRPEIALSLLSPGYTMSSVIANEFPTASSDLHVAALAEIGLVLLLLSLAVNVTARLLVARSRGARVDVHRAYGSGG